MKTEFTFSYQQTGRYFAQIADGMEDLGAAEIAALGAGDVHAVYRGIHFSADKAALYRINYESRLISKILAPLMFCPCRSDDELYRQASKIPWAGLFSVDETFAVFSNVSHSNITHSKYAALRLKDAIVDQFREQCGKRPSVDTEAPDVWLHVFIQNNKATISLETAGRALHRRGYRKATLAAPMNETLAAAVIRLTEWDGATPLHDPMCGSGTLLCEALMHHCRIPSAFFRERFGFEYLPDFDRSVWGAVRKASDGRVRELPPGLISGGDVAVRAVETTRGNLANLPCGDRVGLRATDVREIESLENTTIVCNPPAGVRIGAKEGMGPFMKSFGDFLKQRCKGSTAFIYFGDRQLVKEIGLRTTWKKPLKNGGLDGRLVKIELY